MNEQDLKALNSHISKNLMFTLFFLEQYRAHKNMSGAETYRYFKETGVFDYLYDSYEALHTMGIPYLIGDVDSFIAHSKDPR
jgi:hypothetical protein